MSDPHKYFTAIYRDVKPGDEARAIGEHPKWIAGGWTNIMHERDEAQAALAAAREEREALRAEVERLRALLTEDLPHIYEGQCPDPTQPDSRDTDCAACRLLISSDAAIAGRAGEKAT